MGDPKRTKKHYETPKKPYDNERLETERALVRQYGLKSKRELWRVETILRKKRENARKLLALPLEERVKREKELLDSLAKLGLLSENSTLDDVLTLSIESLLERRLQTMVLRKGLANRAKQARQFTVHGHIAVNGRRVSSPSYLVNINEEKKISYYGKKMQLKPKESKVGKDVKKEFKEALPEGAKAEETAEGKEAEVKGEVKEEKAAGEEEKGNVPGKAKEKAGAGKKSSGEEAKEGPGKKAEKEKEEAGNKKGEMAGAETKKLSEEKEGVKESGK